jgi:organic radical activating enzyme
MIHRLKLRSSEEPRLQKTLDALDAVSPTMCAAKWNQVTIHLQNGTTHSCHHPAVHKVSVEEVLANPNALHNSAFKKEQRRLMLNGKRPEECDYCWRVEDNGSNNPSDRVYKSAEAWAFPDIDRLGKTEWDANVQPSYVEVSFGHACNFKCSYCMPVVSSMWMAEIEKYGPYPTSRKFNNLEDMKAKDMMPIPNREANPYVEAFWKWWPELYPALQHFRITGGEPLMNPNTFKVLDWIIANPRPDLELSINTNMCVPAPLMAKFLDRCQKITDAGSVKKLVIYTSAEAHGAKAEYIRNGLDYAKWLAGIDSFLQDCPDVSFVIMSTFNALSVTSYTPFLADMLALRVKHLGRATDPSHAPLLMDFPYLRDPKHQAAYILTDDYLEHVAATLEWMRDHRIQPENPDVGYNGFHLWEIDKFERLYNVIKGEFASAPSGQRAKRERADFFLFFSEHDRRRGTDFLATFPEMASFYELCRSIADT